MRGALLTTFFLLYSSTILSQDLQFDASLSRSAVGLNEQFELVLELSGSDASKVPPPDAPDLSSFASFVGSSSSQNVQLVNGRMSVSQAYTYHFVATKEGKYQIPSVSISHKGKTYSTTTAEIEVVKRVNTRPSAPPSMNQPASDQQDLSELLFLEGMPDKKRVYQNEPVIVSYKIYWALQVTNYGITQLPSTVGFWVEEYEEPKRPQMYNENIKGRMFRVAEIKKLALFPQGPGKKELNPMAIDCQVQVPRSGRRRDPFDSFFNDPFFARTATRTVASNVVAIDVLPLPEQGKPNDFSGAVGKFSISASLDKNEAKTNEAISLKVTLSGNGNIKILPEPSISFPTDFEIYDPKVQESIHRNENGISGSKSFEYVIIPRFAGEYKIRPISFSYFDPGSKNYRTVTTDAIEINVAKGDKQFVGVGIASSKEDVRFIGEDIRFIQTRLPELKRLNGRIYRGGFFYSLLLLPLLSLGIAYGYRQYLEKMSTNVAYARSRKANQMASRRLRAAERELNNKNQREFYAEVSKALMGFIADKFNISSAGLMTDEVAKMLKERGIAEEVATDYIDCLKKCDFQRFAPSQSDGSDMDGFLQHAKNSIVDLDRVL